MRTIIAASRTHNAPEDVEDALNSAGITLTEVILTGLGSDSVAAGVATGRGVPSRQYDVRNSASRAAMLSRAGAAVIVTDGDDEEIRDLVDAVSTASPRIETFIDLRPAPVVLPT